MLSKSGWASNATCLLRRIHLDQLCIVCSDLCFLVVLILLSCYLGCHVHVVQQSLVAVKFPVFFCLQLTLVKLGCQVVMKSWLFCSLRPVSG